MSDDEKDKPSWLAEIEPDGVDPVSKVTADEGDHEARIEALNRFWDTVDVAHEWVDTPRTEALPEWATISEICDLLRLNRETVTRAIRAGEIPGKKVGAQWRIHVPTLVESWRSAVDGTDGDDGAVDSSEEGAERKKTQSNSNYEPGNWIE